MVKLPVYEHLHNVNIGFAQVIRSLEALRKHASFRRKELDRFTALSKELRAATNSYISGVVETVETKEAGRRFGKRWESQQREE